MFLMTFWQRCLLIVQMTRPGFLLITAVGCALGWACAHFAGVALSSSHLVATLVLALLAHASANVLNDHADALNGADAANSQGVFPFTGGSRLIQQGVVDPSTTQRLAWALLAVVIAGGIGLAWHSGPGLWWIGMIGLGLGWAYSAPPLALMGRGLGEITVALVWALIVVGADYVQRGHFAWLPLQVAVSYGLMIGNILIGNAFPDAPADAQVGKRTLVVRLTPAKAARLYLLVAWLAHTWVLAWVVLGYWPTTALSALLSLPISLIAARWLEQYALQPERLRPALMLGIAAALLHGLCLTWAFWNF